jgi:hypothetical protein
MRLLRAYEVDVGVEAACCNNLVLASDHVCTGSNHHVRIHAIHDIWVACFADSNNDAVFDADVGLEDTSPVDYQRIRDDSVESLRV